MVETEILFKSEAADDLVGFWQSDQVRDVAIMDTNVYFLPDAERGTVRVVVTGALKPTGGPRTGYELLPVEVSVPMKQS